MASHNHEMAQKISRGLLSRYPLIYVLGWEEERIEGLLSLASSSYYGEDGQLLTWSQARGFTRSGELVEAISDPTEALSYIAGATGRAIYLMKDLPAWFNGNPGLVRAAREVYYGLKNSGSHVVLTHPALIIPESLKKEIYLIEMELPSEDEILGYLKPGEAHSGISRDQLYRIAGAMKGLSLNEVDHLQYRIFQSQSVDPSQALIEIAEEKAQLLRKESCLRFFPPQYGLDTVGGLDNLKTWVLKRKDLFSEKAYEAGIPLPSGILLMGVSGCGKSMAAKAIAAAWELPLVRLDMSLVLSGTFGSPEYAFERATQIAGEVAPIVLWVDELENAFGYDERSGSGGGNVNIFSSFLTWLQEKSPKIFVAATANRIQELPAELMRKGRFDQLFFLDLPTKDERMEIFRIHIQLNGGDPSSFNIGYLAAATKEWSGAEIEQAVKSARIDAYQEDRPFADKDIERNCIRQVPLSQTMTEQIKAIKDWSFNRAVPASSSRG
jgi:SpoVK/Ycf46/Vps4 family AAA+-type ATPase